MEILLMLIFSVSNIVCFVVGAKVGQKVSKGETIETPNLNPVKAYHEYQSQKEADRKQNRLDAIMRNIENYDGTGIGQEDVPRG